MQTVLVSALTAAVVTLLIEFAAKPHLEVRKDRILEAHRARRELISHIELVVAELPPIQGALPFPLHRKPGVEAVEDFLATVSEIRAMSSRASHGLGALRRKAIRTQVNGLAIKEATARHLLQVLESVDQHAGNLVNDPLATLVQQITANLLGLRAGLLTTIGNPWSGYRTLRRLAREQVGDAVQHTRGQDVETPASD